MLPIPESNGVELDLDLLRHDLAGQGQTLTFVEAGVGQLRERMERQEQAFLALLQDVASNPHTAAERARAILTGIVPFTPGI